MHTSHNQALSSARPFICGYGSISLQDSYRVHPKLSSMITFMPTAFLDSSCRPHLPVASALNTLPGETPRQAASTLIGKTCYLLRFSHPRPWPCRDGIAHPRIQGLWRSANESGPVQGGRSHGRTSVQRWVWATRGQARVPKVPDVRDRFLSILPHQSHLPQTFNPSSAN